MLDEVDVLIIGSGHSGGMAAKVLTEKGISCVMLNAGPVADIRKDTELRQAFTLPYRGFRQPGQLPHVFQANEFNANTWVDEKEVPYTYAPASPYNWVRVRLFGGRSLFWSRQSFRLSDYEFKAKSRDGFGDDWPISLADLAPYYSRVEEIFRVEGEAAGLPQFPDGNFVPLETPWGGAMERFRKVGEQRGVPVCRQRTSLGVNGLASSINLLLPDAFETGKLEAIPNVVVRELRVNPNDRAGPRGALRGSHLATGDVDEGAGGSAGGGNAREHAATAELEDRKLERRDGPLPDRSDLRRGHRLLRTRGARRQEPRAS